MEVLRVAVSQCERLEQLLDCFKHDVSDQPYFISHSCRSPKYRPIYDQAGLNEQIKDILPQSLSGSPVSLLLGVSVGDAHVALCGY
jgi:hypothetical protein